MVTPEAGKGQVTVKLELLLRAMMGSSHCSVTEPLRTVEVIMPSLTAMALMVTPLTFSFKGSENTLLDVLGVLPSVV